MTNDLFEKGYVWHFPANGAIKNFYSVCWCSKPNANFNELLEIFQKLTGKRFADILQLDPDGLETLVNIGHISRFQISVISVCDSINEISLNNSKIQISGVWDDIRQAYGELCDTPKVDIINHTEEIFNTALNAIKEETCQKHSRKN